MEVKVNGQLIEIGDSSPAITKRSVDINNPSARFIDITNRFNLPDTQANRKVFENPYQVGSNNRALDKVFDVSIFDVFELFRGKGYLTQISDGSMGLQVIDASKDVFNALEKKIREISWDDKDTVLTQAAIAAQDEYDVSNCWIWGKMCCHRKPIQANTDQTTGDARTKYSRPQFNVNALLKRAIESIGYTFVEPDERLAISSNHKQFFFADYQKSFSNVVFNPVGTLQITGWDVYDFRESSVTAVSASVKGLSKHNYRVRGNFTTSADVYLRISSIDQTGTKPITNTIKLPASGFLDYSTSEIYDGPTGMTTTFFLIGTGSVTFEDVLIYKIVDEKNEDLSTNHFLDHYIKAYDNFPDDLTYTDLWKLICLMFNKYPVVDTYNKVFSFGSMAKINKLNAVDWSSKFVINSDVISNNFSNMYQKNLLKYNNDITVPFGHAEDYFLTDNEILPSEGEYMMLPFGSTIDVVVNSNTIAQVEVYDDTTRITTVDLNRRVFNIVGERLTFDGLHWEDLKSGYYANFFNSLYRIRAITCDFNLSKLDVLQWEKDRLVYIDYFKTTFIVLEIANFIPGKLTKVKLLAYGR